MRKSLTRWKIAGLTLILALTLVGGRVLAEGGPLSISWWTVDGGGGTSSGGTLSMSGTIGQSDAGAMQGGSFTLSGGFWNGGTVSAPGQQVFLPLVMR